MIYDISRALTPRTAVFPGDTPVSIVPVMQMRTGDSCNVSALTLSAHAGTHVDAPRHYSDDGAGIEAVPLDVLIGPARVITLDVEQEMTLDALQSALASRVPARLLIHTRASRVPNEVWDGTFVHIAPEAAEWLGASGLRLIGVDTPSVDPATSKALPTHKTFLRHGTLILENLCLRDVPDGEYELIALPLAIKGNDAGPARVVLRKN